MIFTRKPNFTPNSPRPQFHPDLSFISTLISPRPGPLPLDRIFELFVKTIIYMPVANFFFVHEIF